MITINLSSLVIGIAIGVIICIVLAFIADL